MIRYTLIRSVWIFIVLFVVLSINFTLLRLAPQFPPPDEDARSLYYERQVHDGMFSVRVEDDPEQMQAIMDGEVDLPDSSYVFREPSAADVQRLRIYEPVPIPQQYASWVDNIVTEWNWGTDYTNTPVFEVLQRAIPVTVMLNVFALIFYIPVGFTLGIIAALKKNSTTDNAISFSVMVFISVPSFVIMTLLILVFGYQLDWLPTRYYASDITGFIPRLRAFILPVLGSSFGALAGLTRTTRAELTEVLTSEFLLLARTKGLTRPQAVVRHAMRNSMVPLVPGIIASFVGLLSGSVVIEEIYSIPGTGRIFVQAIRRNDFNLALGVTAFYTTISLVSVLFVDLSYGLVDPRIRMGARK